MAHDVFISYSARDKPTANAVCGSLEQRGIRCWVAPRDVEPGADWAESIIDAIAAAPVMVLVLSAPANESPQIKREVERAIAKGTVIIPFRIEDVVLSKSLEYYISTAHWLDAMTPPLEAHLDRLAETVARITGNRVEKSGGAPPVLPAAHSSVPMAAAKRRLTVPVGMAVAVIASMAGWFALKPLLFAQDPAANPASAQSTPAPVPVTPPESLLPLDSDARIAQLQQQAIADPQNADARTQIGNLHFDAERFQQAIPWYEGALRIRPADVNVRTDLGVTFYYMNEPDRALQQFAEVLRVDPAHTKALLNRGIVLAFGKQDLAGAAASWERVVALKPDSEEGRAARKGLDGIRGAKR